MAGTAGWRTTVVRPFWRAQFFGQDFVVQGWCSKVSRCIPSTRITVTFETISDGTIRSNDDRAFLSVSCYGPKLAEFRNRLSRRTGQNSSRKTTAKSIGPNGRRTCLRRRRFVAVGRVSFVNGLQKRRITFVIPYIVTRRICADAKNREVDDSYARSVKRPRTRNRFHIYVFVTRLFGSCNAYGTPCISLVFSVRFGSGRAGETNRRYDRGRFAFVTLLVIASKRHVVRIYCRGLQIKRNEREEKK